jgi:galactose mutarotase-like enzyme
MLNLENEYLKIQISPKGAELNSIYHKIHQIEYLWSGDPAFWGKKSPILFPIIGTLKDNTYLYKGEQYHLSRHGFARERDFEVVKQSEIEIEFRLTSDETTLKIYPFNFHFSLIYRIEESKLSVTYRIVNKSKRVMYASVGAHPAFKVPLTEGLNYEDYYLEFSASENAGRYPINAEGLIKTPAEPCLQNTNKLPLTKALFQKDALVFKDLCSTQVQIKSDKNAHGLKMTYEGFPFFGIWAAPNADFVCLEPWCGIADGEVTNQDFTTKEGILKVGLNKKIEKCWFIDIF